MKSALEYGEMWGVVSGMESCPADDVFSADGHKEWKKKDAAAKTMFFQCVKPELLVKIAHAQTSNEMWTTLETEFSQTGSGSIMMWFRRLTRQLQPGGDVSAHVTGFQEAIRYLAKADFEIPGFIASAILLASLPSNPNDPHSWNNHVAGVKIDKKTTTLPSVISGILEEKRRLTEDDDADAPKQDTALAALERSARARGKLFCSNCKREGHAAHNCWGPGGAKEGQGPSRSKGKARGKSRKGKEKAHHTTDGGGGGSDDEDSHHVIFEKCLMVSETTSSAYSSPADISNASTHLPPLTEDISYSMHTKSSSPVIIDSGTSSHIHSNRADFKSLKTSSSGSISGFGDGKSRIEGRGEADLLAKLPKGGCARLKLKNVCYVPDSSPTLISVSRLDEAACYTLFGNGKCVTFSSSDNGKLIEKVKSSSRVIFTGTMGSDRLYHLDVPQLSSREFTYTTTRVPVSKLELLHYALGHLNYQAIVASIRKGTILGVKLSETELRATPPRCDACLKGKATRASFSTSQSGHADTVLGLVHCDLWGPAPVQSQNGTRYVMTFTDDKSRWVWAYFLRRKSDAFAAFKEWLAYVELQTSSKLRILRTDGGGEFMLKLWVQFLKDRGIRHEITSAHTPEQNGDTSAVAIRPKRTYITSHKVSVKCESR